KRGLWIGKQYELTDEKKAIGIAKKLARDTNSIILIKRFEYDDSLNMGIIHGKIIISGRKIYAKHGKKANTTKNFVKVYPDGRVEYMK
ncbi:MAG: hypothetical protein J7K83_02545, partial [Candidatus Aenigmarchaeota archaeon]|nr:hypothetical protein [Candidatus Aenigmarchaeota archaeon]